VERHSQIKANSTPSATDPFSSEQVILKRIRACKDQEIATQGVKAFLKMKNDPRCDTEALARRLLHGVDHEDPQKVHASGTPAMISPELRDQVKSLPPKLRYCAGLLKREDVLRMLCLTLIPGGHAPAPLRASVVELGKLSLSNRTNPGNFPPDIPPDRGNLFHKLPEWLDQVAEAIDGYVEHGNFRSGFDDWLLFTISRVKQETGRPHYAEIANILEPLLGSVGVKRRANCGLSDTLKTLMNRSRKKS
jgi:hypothetical protein